jgi:hypothetical protein
MRLHQPWQRTRIIAEARSTYCSESINAPTLQRPLMSLITAAKKFPAFALSSFFHTA